MIAAIIQARMGSTRLPGKVMMEIAGQPMLWQVANRARQATLTDQVVIATSNQKGDDPVAAFCEQAEIPCFRGSETDVLDRYYQAAQWIGADVVVRLTADCPLLDPTVVDQVAAAYLEGGCDYASNTIERTYPDGLDTEVFSFATLARAWREAELLSEREHVTPYIWKNSHLFRLLQVRQATDLSSWRWTVDEPEDLAFVRRVYERLYRPGKTFLIADVVALLVSQPELAQINQGFLRNEGYLRSLQHDHIIQLPVDEDE
ncbi:MAG: glycosyltransferase family protein [Chloroflexi bacterium]|nr:glycosyltransferase family protein [Chloroflexota bacterium]